MYIIFVQMQSIRNIKDGNIFQKKKGRFPTATNASTFLSRLLFKNFDGKVILNRCHSCVLLHGASKSAKGALSSTQYGRHS